MERLESEFSLKVPVAQLWPMISDTERLNRAVGMAPVQYRTEGNPSGPAHLFAQMKMGPMTLKYQDFPFEWVQEDHFHVVRRYTTGPLKEMRPGVSLAANNGSTQIRVFLEFDPRNALGAWIARHILWPGLFRKYRKILRAMETYLLDNAPDPFWQATPKGVVDQDRLNALVERLRQAGEKADLLDFLQSHLTNAPDLDVMVMRPFVLADRWSKDRIDVLKLFLHATRAGLLDLSWEILCPNCRKSKATAPSLAGVVGQAHCEYCQIKFDAEFDRSVEARFTVNPSARKTQRKEFCAGGPGNTPHILAQILVYPGQKRNVTLHVLGAPLRVRSPQIEGPARVRVLDMSPSSLCRLTLQEKSIEPATREVRAGDVLFELENQTDQPRWIILERERWDEAVATAAQVTSLQEFRDMFSSDVLAPGEEIAVRSLTFLFTDLAGSTAAYHDMGDAKAYSIVREHFTVLKEVIAKREGALVKTIGDAVMAVFYSPRQGFLAALDMQRDIGAWNASRKGDTPVVLKIGLHEGPAVAVNAGDVLDYFGTSVNLAARVESLSRGGDIVVSDSVMRAVEGSKEMEAIAGKPEKLESPVKGFPQPILAWRIMPK